MSYVMLEKLGFKVGNRHVGIDPVNETIELEGQFSEFELGVLGVTLEVLGRLLSAWNHEQGEIDG